MWIVCAINHNIIINYYITPKLFCINTCKINSLLRKYIYDNRINKRQFLVEKKTNMKSLTQLGKQIRSKLELLKIIFHLLCFSFLVNLGFLL